jgi:hypothetical protein
LSARSPFLEEKNSYSLISRFELKKYSFNNEEYCACVMKSKCWFCDKKKSGGVSARFAKGEIDGRNKQTNICDPRERGEESNGSKIGFMQIFASK